MPGITTHKPTGLQRTLFRAPIWLYRAHLGWLLGKRFLLLTHIGRKSRQFRQVILEVVWHEPETGAFFVAAGWRDEADWFKNIKANPAVQFTVGTKTFSANAEIVEPPIAAGIFLAYARRNPAAFREISSIMIGERLGPHESDCARLAQSVPLVKLIPLQRG